MFIAALLTTPKAWKKPNSASTDYWVKMWCVYTHTQRCTDVMEYY